MFPIRVPVSTLVTTAQPPSSERFNKHFRAPAATRQCPGFWMGWGVGTVQGGDS